MGGGVHTLPLANPSRRLFLLLVCCRSLTYNPSCALAQLHAVRAEQDRQEQRRMLEHSQQRLEEQQKQVRTTLLRMCVSL